MKCFKAKFFMCLLFIEFLLFKASYAITNSEAQFYKTQIEFSNNNIHLAIKACLSAVSLCDLSATEQKLLTKILIHEPSPAPLIFSSKASDFILPGEVSPRSAKTGDRAGDVIYINSRFLKQFDVWSALAILIHEYGHHHSELDHVELDAVGAKVKHFIRSRGSSFSDRNIEVIIFSIFNSIRQFSNAVQDKKSDIARPLLLVKKGNEVLDVYPIMEKHLRNLYGKIFSVIPLNASWVTTEHELQLEIPVAFHANAGLSGTGMSFLVDSNGFFRLSIPLKGSLARHSAQYDDIGPMTDSKYRFKVVENFMNPDHGWRLRFFVDFTFAPEVDSALFNRCQAKLEHSQIPGRYPFNAAQCEVKSVSPKRAEVTVSQPLNPNSRSGELSLSEIRFLSENDDLPLIAGKHFSKIYNQWVGSLPIPMKIPSYSGVDSQVSLNVFSVITPEMVEGYYTVCSSHRNSPMRCDYLQMDESFFSAQIHHRDSQTKWVIGKNYESSDYGKVVFKDFVFVGAQCEMYLDSQVYQFDI